jgi:hypothetical protein
MSDQLLAEATAFLHNTTNNSTRASTSSIMFGTAFTAIQRTQICALNSTATGIGKILS